MPNNKLNKGFLCLHLGAGFHSETKRDSYKRVCEDALQLGVNLLNNQSTCVEVVTKVTAFLENSELTNAGSGSNLTINGTVECEAAIMESANNAYAAVGCVQGVRNPIQVANVVLREQGQIKPLGLVSPMVLVGDGVREKAKEYEIEICDDPKTLLSKKALKDHKKFKALLEKHQPSHHRRNIGSVAGTKRKMTQQLTDSLSRQEATGSQNLKADCSDAATKTIRVERHDYFDDTDVKALQFESKDDTRIGDNLLSYYPVVSGIKKADLETVETLNEKSTISEEEDYQEVYEENDAVDELKQQGDFDEIRNDTIGVICIDGNLEMASTVSSGGLLLKQSGRLGPCTQFGAGCWAFKYDDQTTIGSCCSGTGEAIMRTHLAENVCRYVYQDPNNITDLEKFTREELTRSRYLSSCLLEQQRHCGFLLVALHQSSSSSSNEKNDNLGKDENLNDELVKMSSNKETDDLGPGEKVMDGLIRTFSDQENTEFSIGENAVDGFVSMSSTEEVDNLSQGENFHEENSQAMFSNKKNNNFAHDDKNANDELVEGRREASVDFYFTHTTDSFCVGFIASGGRGANFVMSRLRKDEDTSVKGFHFVI